MPKSKVLILIIGSNNKQKGGTQEYNPSLSIAWRLPHSHALLLTETRKRALKLIRTGGVTRHDVRIADLPSNQNLVDGPEFGGTGKNGLYLPAAKRFQGRLYKELGTDGIERLIDGPHHFLILTGLYGLVTPSEPIQDHQCHIDDHPAFRKLWTDEDRLTEILIAYIRQLGITRVFDLTAQNSYRSLIAWERVRVATEGVLHCYGKQTVGPEFLIPLGYLIKELLTKSTEDKLMAIRARNYFDTPYEQVHFQSVPRPPVDAPHEIERQSVELDVADELGRMRRCIIRMLDAVEQRHPEKENREGIQERIRWLSLHSYLPSGIAEHMLDITRIRNKVEYDGYKVSDSRLQAIRSEYAEIKKWAKTDRLGLPSECLEI